MLFWGGASRLRIVLFVSHVWLSSSTGSSLFFHKLVECWLLCSWKYTDYAEVPRATSLQKKSALSVKKKWERPKKKHTGSDAHINTERMEKRWVAVKRNADPWSPSGGAKTGHWSSDIHKWKIHGRKELLGPAAETRDTGVSLSNRNWHGVGTSCWVAVGCAGSAGGG